MTTRSAWALGLATVTDDGNTLDVWYPRPILGDAPDDGDAELLARLTAMETKDAARGVHTRDNCFSRQSLKFFSVYQYFRYF